MYLLKGRYWCHENFRTTIFDGSLMFEQTLNTSKVVSSVLVKYLKYDLNSKQANQRSKGPTGSYWGSKIVQWVSQLNKISLRLKMLFGAFCIEVRKEFSAALRKSHLVSKRYWSSLLGLEKGLMGIRRSHLGSQG